MKRSARLLVGSRQLADAGVYRLHVPQPAVPAFPKQGDISHHP